MHAVALIFGHIFLHISSQLFNTPTSSPKSFKYGRILKNFPSVFFIDVFPHAFEKKIKRRLTRF